MNDVPSSAVQSAIYPSLAGKRVVITGGGSGIGAGLVEAFARQGAETTFVDILETESRELVARLSGTPIQPVFHRLDLTDLAAMEAVKQWRFEPARRGKQSVAVWHAPSALCVEVNCHPTGSAPHQLPRNCASVAGSEPTDKHHKKGGGHAYQYLRQLRKAQGGLSGMDTAQAGDPVENLGQ